MPRVACVPRTRGTHTSPRSLPPPIHLNLHYVFHLPLPLDTSNTHRSRSPHHRLNGTQKTCGSPLFPQRPSFYHPPPPLSLPSSPPSRVPRPPRSSQTTQRYNHSPGTVPNKPLCKTRQECVCVCLLIPVYSDQSLPLPPYPHLTTHPAPISFPSVCSTFPRLFLTRERHAKNKEGTPPPSPPSSSPSPTSPPSVVSILFRLAALH